MFQPTEVINPKIDGLQVTMALYNQVSEIRGRGGKCYVAIIDLDEDEGIDACQQCNGVGWQYLQHVIGGPFESPAGKKGLIFEGGKWYQVKTDAFLCPTCGASHG